MCRASLQLGEGGVNRAVRHLHSNDCAVKVLFAMFRTSFHALLFAIVFETVVSERFIQSWLNYDCDPTECRPRGESNKSSIDLIYSKISDTNSTNTIHHVWSTIGQTPGFFIVHTNSSKNIHIDWKALLNNKEKSVNFEPSSVVNTIGILFSKIYFWQDKKENGSFDKTNPSSIHAIDYNQLVWADIANYSPNIMYNKTSCEASFTLATNHSLYNGNITFKVRIVTQKQRYPVLPHLWIDNKTLYIEALIDGMQFNESKVRLAVELTLLTSGNQFKSNVKRSIDDENSPGVFQVFIISQ
ncbi:hypothetical protein B4U79_09171 [Dinothrombium tinctorium]|uniref:Uncharacterized protein n=1 Tax=Dinothrombium tinctorium TaxID=1965070 RepID=A0A443RME5_9ACAR|nr:hypothetical protein B4U79_09171 [Dinothrombium tinctorium]